MLEDRLYLERYFRYEEKLADLIGARADVAPTILESEIETVLRDLLPPESGGRPNYQHLAAAAALTGRLTVIAGGPGTGKTYTVARMLAALAHRSDGFPRVALCAPTGKAAARLKEMVEEFIAGEQDPTVVDLLDGVQIRTIHRLLGWAWKRSQFFHHEGNQLPHDLVIVDEMSMVSLPLAAKLIAAVRSDAHELDVHGPGLISRGFAFTGCRPIPLRGGRPATAHAVVVKSMPDVSELVVRF